MAGRPYFSRATFAFLKDLAANNDRSWFESNRERYEDHVKIPALRFIQDFGPVLDGISPHFVAGPRSLFRIHRDVRFSKDKSPYKTHTGIQFRHARARDVHAPGFYLHVEPGASFVALGMWHPVGPALRKVRERIVEHPEEWRAAVEAPAFTRTFERDGDRLTRPPRGFDAEHPLVEELKWKDHLGVRSVPQSFVTDPELPRKLGEMLAAGTPLMRFLCAAVDAEF
ncbi:MAG: DUF2461 domain-containing protein [Longimicrobiales bacterium]